MTDRPQDPQLEGRLQAWFAGEVRRAAADLAAPTFVVRPVIAGPIRRRVTDRRPAALAAVGLVAVLVAVSVGSRLLTTPAVADRDGPPTLSPGPATSTLPGQVPTAPFLSPGDIVSAWFADGVPSRIIDEPVMRPSEALANEDAGTLHGLVGGWLRPDIDHFCPIQIPSAGATLDPNRCDRLSLGESESSATVIGFQPPVGFTATSGIAVIRLDPGVRPTLVTTIDPSFPAERSPDGIPSVWNGQPVHRASELKQLIADATGDRTYLVAGWATNGTGRGCPAFPRRPTPDPLVLTPRCGGVELSETPGDNTPGLMASAPTTNGPVIARVHIYDPVASHCLTRSLCANSVVIEGIEWPGDAWTATQPQDISAVVSKLGLVISSDGVATLPGETQVVRPYWERRPPNTRGGIPLRCDYGIPPQAWVVTNDPKLGRIYVFASVAERTRFEPFFGGNGALSSKNADGSACSTIVDGAFATHWVAVDNVMVEVHTGFTPSAEDNAYVQEVEGRLRGS